MSISALCLPNQITVNTWLDGPYCFYICIDVEVRGGLYWDIAQKGKTKRSCKNKIAHFQRMRHLLRHPLHGTTGPNTGRTVRLSNQCSIESTGTFTEMKNQAASECSPSSLSTQASTQTKPLRRNSSFGM